MSRRSQKVIFCRRQGLVIELCDPILYLSTDRWNKIVFFCWWLSIKCILDQYYCIKWRAFMYKSIADVFSLLLWIIYVSWDTLLQNIEILYYIWKYNKPLRKQIFIISFFLFFRIFPWNPFHHCEATLFAVLKIVKYFVRCLNIYVSFYKDKSELQYLCKV